MKKKAREKSVKNLPTILYPFFLYHLIRSMLCSSTLRNPTLPLYVSSFSFLNRLPFYMPYRVRDCWRLSLTHYLAVVRRWRNLDP